MANHEEEDMEGEMAKLPSALIATIMTKLDVASICSFASTCKTSNSCASQLLHFLPEFHLLNVALSVDLVRHLLPPNPYLRSLKVNCNRLDDTSIEHMIKPSLHDLCLQNCVDFSGKLLSVIGERCKDLRALYLGSVAEKRGRSVHISDLEDLLTGCTQLETLILMFDTSLFLRHNFIQVWALASPKLTSLEIGYISSVTVTELLNPLILPHQSLNHLRHTISPNIRKLCLSVDYITDAMVITISIGLIFLSYLDLRDAPFLEPLAMNDLTNSGLQLINQHGRLKHLSLIRSQEFADSCFSRVNDLGMLFMADRCSNIESISLGGFCRVTDTGFKTILHSCSSLYKLKITRGTHLTDLVFHDIAATSLSLTHVSLRWCNLLTNHAVTRLVSNKELKVLELRNCKILGDEALRAISTLHNLKILLLDGSDISDAGLSYLKRGMINSLVSLSIRGCKRITDRCITNLFNGSSSRMELQELDLSNLPSLTDNGILSLAKNRISLLELRLRQCPLVGDTSIMALASMQTNENGWNGSSLHVLDIFGCGRITQLAFRWLKKPYFPRLRWLGLTGSGNRDMVDKLIRTRPFLHVACHGEELGTDQWNNSDGFYMHDYDEVDELEQWLDEDGNDDEEMAEDENNDQLEE